MKKTDLNIKSKILFYIKSKKFIKYLYFTQCTRVRFKKLDYVKKNFTLDKTGNPITVKVWVNPGSGLNPVRFGKLLIKISAFEKIVVRKLHVLP